MVDQQSGDVPRVLLERLADLAFDVQPGLLAGWLVAALAVARVDRQEDPGEVDGRVLGADELEAATPEGS